MAFRLYADDNVVYQWSLYQVHGDQTQQYIESCTLSLKEVVNSFISAKKAETTRGNESVVTSPFQQKELKLQFSKTGMQLAV